MADRSKLCATRDGTPRRVGRLYSASSCCFYRWEFYRQGFVFLPILRCRVLCIFPPLATVSEQDVFEILSRTTRWRRPFLCEVEMTSDGITTKQGGAETKRWSAVKEIVETPDSLDFVWHGGGLLVVRNRAFHTPELRSTYIRTAREFLASSSDARPSQPTSS